MRSQLIVLALKLPYLNRYRCVSLISTARIFKNNLILGLALISLLGCALSTKVESDFGTKIDSSISSMDTIHNPQYKIAVVAVSKDYKFAECVERGLRSRLRKSIVLSEEKFRDVIYPHTQLCEKPTSKVQVHELLSNPIINLKLLDIELDFIVYVGGSTHWKGGDGFMAPPAAPFPLILGYKQTERKTNIRTTILDIKRSRLLGKAVVRSKGIVAIPIVGLWVPIPLGLSTESSACNKTAQHIANSLIRRSFYSQNVEDAEDQSQLTKIDSTKTASDPVNRWYIAELKRLATEDNAEDQLTLGLMYYKGNRVEQDYREAYTWLLKAAEQGLEDAKVMIEKLCREQSEVCDQTVNVHNYQTYHDQDQAKEDTYQEASVSCSEIAGNYEASVTDNCGGKKVTSDIAVKVAGDCSFVARAYENGLITKGTITAQSGSNYGGNATNKSGCGTMELNCTINASSFACNL